MTQVSVLSLVTLTCAALVADFLGVFLTYLQISAALPAAIAVSISNFIRYLGINLGIEGLVTSTVVAIYSVQFIIAIVVICVFFSIVLASPKGTYTMLDCVVALFVFILESIPFIAALTCWGFFVLFLRWRLFLRSDST